MNCNKDILTIPRGNGFKLHICLSDVAPSNPNGVTFSDVEGMEAYIVRFLDERTSVAYDITDSGDLLLDVPSDALAASLYGIELTGAYNGQPWRFKCAAAFRITDSNCVSSAQGMETFGTETYYIRDVLVFEEEDNTLAIMTEGHASLDNDTLTLQATEGTALCIHGDTLEINYIN